MSNLEPVKIEILLRQNIAKELEESRKALEDVDSGVKKTANSFKDVDTGLKKSSESIKMAIAAQRQLIREITGDINALKAAAKDEAPGAALNEILGDLRGARKALAEEQATLIGLQREQLDVNNEEKQSTEGVVESLKNWAIGLASVGTVLAVFNSVVDSTRASSDQFQVAVAGAKSGLAFFWKTLASGDWSNFFENMDRAIRTGSKYAEMMDKIKEATWALDIAEADSNKQALELEDKLRNKQLPREERIKAGEDRIKLEEELAAKRTKIGQDEFDAALLVAMDRSKLSKETLMDAIKDIDSEGKAKAEKYNKDLELSKQYRRDLKAAAGSNNMYGVQAAAGMLDKIKPQLQVSDKVKQDAEILRGVGNLTDEMTNNVVESYVKMKEAQDSAMENTTRVRSMTHTLLAGEDNADKKTKEAEGLDNRIKAIRDQMDLVADANSAEFAALAKKLVMLEAEKKLRQSIVDMQMMIANNQTIDSKGATSSVSAIYDMAKAGGINLDKLKLNDTDLEIAKLKKGNAAREAEANKLRKKYNIEEKKDTKELAEEYYAVADAADMLANAIGDSNAGLADMLKDVSQVAGQMGNLVKAGAFSKGGMSKGDAIGATISGATQLIGIVAGAAAERKRVMDEYYASIIAQQQQYNLLLNDQLRLNSDIHGSVFFKDYEGSLKDSTKAYNDANNKYNEETKKFATAEAITGKKNVVSGANVLGGVGAGAAAGAGIGALLGGGVLSVPAAAAGAIIGSVVGLFAGLFAKKKKDVVAPLLETYKDLITPAGEFNEVLAKTLIANNKVTEATKATLQRLIDWKEQAKLAREQLTSVISDLTGSLGDDLRNSLVTAFKDGTDAATAFGGSVNKVLENVMSNMIFNKVFEGAFKKLEDGMNASYGIGPDGKPIDGAQVDGTWADDLKIFFDQSKGLTDQFNKGMSDAKAEAAANGMDIFGKDNSAASATGMKGDMQRMTEETASALTGNVTAIRINMARMIESGTTSMTMLQKSLEYQLRTADNTDVMSKTLGSIDTRLSRLELDGIKVK